MCCWNFLVLHTLKISPSYHPNFFNSFIGFWTPTKAPTFPFTSPSPYFLISKDSLLVFFKPPLKDLQVSEILKFDPPNPIQISRNFNLGLLEVYTTVQFLSFHMPQHMVLRKNAKCYQENLQSFSYTNYQKSPRNG